MSKSLRNIYIMAGRTRNLFSKQLQVSVFSTLPTVAMASVKPLALIFLAFALAATKMASAGDPDILTDFVIPPEYFLPVGGSFFTYTGFRGLLYKNPDNFTVTKASMAEFPALNGQSVSYALLQYPPGTVNPPHTHPRASELLFVLSGFLEVGFVDTKNVLYTRTLQSGDMFVFPKGLVHFQYNPTPNVRTTALSAFGSASAGTVSVPTTVFGTGISEAILAKAFKTDVGTIQKIESGFAKH